MPSCFSHHICGCAAQTMMRMSLFEEDEEEDEVYFFAGQGTPCNTQKSKHSFADFLLTRNTSKIYQKTRRRKLASSTISTRMSKRTVSLMSRIHTTRFTLISRQSRICYRQCRTASTATQRNPRVNPSDSVVGVERFTF
jgi:hypothetical protein